MEAAPEKMLFEIGTREADTLAMSLGKLNLVLSIEKKDKSMTTKTLRIEATLADVSLVLEQEFAVEVPAELQAIVKSGMASVAYRAGASKAFKGVKDRSTLTYEQKVAALTNGMKAVNMTIVSHEAYVAPEKETGMVKATKEYEKALGLSKLVKLAEVVEYAGNVNDKPKMIAAIHEWFKKPISY